VVAERNVGKSTGQDERRGLPPPLQTRDVSSPLQYLKRIRLDHARRLMGHAGYNPSTAARVVGYESPSQFSREFKRLFGVTPVEEAEQTRARLVAGWSPSESAPWTTRTATGFAGDDSLYLGSRSERLTSIS
jgi:hypothetical protein